MLKVFFAIIASILFYFIFNKIDFYIAHSAGAMLIASIISPGIFFNFLNLINSDNLSHIVSVLINFIYYLIIIKIYYIYKNEKYLNRKENE